MTYENFQNEFITKLRIRLNDVLSVSFDLKIVHPQCHSKPSYTGLQFVTDGMTLCPIVNLDEFYRMYTGGMEIRDMIEAAAELFSCDYSPAAEQYTQIVDYAYSKPHIIYKLINRKRNAALLESVPHIRLLDLAIIFEIMMDDAISGGKATCLIRHDMMRQWDVDVDELLAQASVNTPKLLSPKVRTLSDTMIDLLQKSSEEAEHIEELSDLCFPPVIVLTNSRMTYGASVILYRDMLQHLSDIFCDDFYLIPSSIHEMLAIPAGASAQSGRELTDMLREVNRTEIAEEDFLSDNVYYYNRARNQLGYCCN